MSAFFGSEDQNISDRDSALRGLARRLVSNEHDLEDVVQDTWLAAMEQPQERVRNADGWLRTVMRYTASRSRRREAQRIHRERIVADRRSEEEEEHAREDPSVEALHRIQGAVDQLREPYRGVVRLRFFEGLSLDQIELQLERPRATIKSQLRRAVSKLREAMDREYGGDRAIWRMAVMGALRLGEPAAQPDPKPGQASATPSAPLALKALMAVGLIAAIVVVAPRLLGNDEQPRPIDVSSAPAPVVELQSDAPINDTPAAQERIELQTPEVGSIDARPGSVRVRTRDELSSEPVESLPIMLEPISHELLVSEGSVARVRITSEDGTVVWNELAAGHWLVTPMRGEERKIEVVQGRETTVDMEITVGVVLRGRAVQPNELPVQDAAVFVSFPGRRDRWEQVTRSDWVGDFEVFADPASWIYAAKDTFAGSPVTSLGSPELAAGDAELELILGSTGPLIPGNVLDATGNPVPDAQVRISALSTYGLQLGKHGISWTNRVPRETRTDAEGKFLVNRVNPAVNQITVVAPGHAPTRATIPGGVWPKNPMRICLGEANAVQGRFLNAAGEPVPEVRVELEQPWPFDPRHARTDAEGRFELPDVAPGFFRLRAVSEREGSFTTERTIAAGQTVTLDEELTHDWDITGRALSEGVTLKGWNVVAVEQSELDVRHTVPVDSGWTQHEQKVTGSDGSFSFPGRLGVAHVVLLFPPGKQCGMPSAWVRDVYPGRPVDLILARQNDATGVVAGSFDIETYARLRGGKALLRSVELNHVLHRRLDDRGDFRFEHLVPGTYELLAWRPEMPPALCATVHLSGGEERDLRTVRIPVDGSLAISVRTPVGMSLKDMQVQIISEYTRFGASLGRHSERMNVEDDGTTYVRALPPGNYHLRIETLQFSDIFARFQVEEGRETRLAFALEPGSRMRVELKTAVPLRPQSRIDLSIVRQDGSSPVTFDNFRPTVPEGPFVLNFRFPSGDYRITASSECGLQGETRLTLPVDETSLTAVSLDLAR